jgi:hypothetical protein
MMDFKTLQINQPSMWVGALGYWLANSPNANGDEYIKRFDNKVYKRTIVDGVRGEWELVEQMNTRIASWGV